MSERKIYVEYREHGCTTTEAGAKAFINSLSVLYPELKKATYHITEDNKVKFVFPSEGSK
jgi:hypothetical protein